MFNCALTPFYWVKCAATGAKIANNSMFAFFFGAMVLLNAIFMGFCVRHAMNLYREDPKKPLPELMLYAEQTFSAIFSLR